MKLAIAYGVLAVGLTLFILSQFWVQMFPGTSTWTPERAEEWAQVKDRLHNLSFVVHDTSGEPPRRHPNKEAAKAEYDKVKARANELRTMFETAYDAPRTTATVLKWTGISLFALGLVGWFAFKEQQT